LIEIINLRKKFGNFQLKNINLSVNKGEYFILLGPSGAGKTVFIECIAGLHKIDSGKIIIDGTDVTNLPPEKRNIGLVFQEYALFPHMSVRENIEYGLKAKKIPKERRDQLIRETAKILRIENILDRSPKNLSGGEKQRVALARALVIEPKVLLLDEPLSALDAPMRRELREELRRIHREICVTTIHVTHDQIEAYSLSDRVGVIFNGKLFEVGPPEDVFRRPKNEDVAKFLGFENIFKGSVKEYRNGLSEIDINGVIIEVAGHYKGEVTVAVRPEDITIYSSRIESSARNKFLGKIIDYIDLGALVKLKIDIGIPISALITKKSFLDLNLQRERQVHIAFKASSVHII